MFNRPHEGAILVGLLLLCLFSHPACAQPEQEWTRTNGSHSTVSAAPPSAPYLNGKHGVSIEAVVVNPYRSANVGSEVGGVIERFHFEEGDLVEGGTIVAELNPRRYKLVADRADERLKALEAALKRAEEEARLREELFELDAATRQDLLKAKAEVEIAGFRVAETRKELDLALFELGACKLKAPFTGHIALKYKQPDETVERLEKVFSIVDSSKVHSVANVPESLLSALRKGTEAVFFCQPDRRFKGIVDRVGKLIDPKSRTKRVYLLIDNAANELEVGMTGSLQLLK